MHAGTKELVAITSLNAEIRLIDQRQPTEFRLILNKKTPINQQKPHRQTTEHHHIRRDQKNKITRTQSILPVLS